MNTCPIIIVGVQSQRGHYTLTIQEEERRHSILRLGTEREGIFPYDSGQRGRIFYLYDSREDTLPYNSELREKTFYPTTWDRDRRYSTLRLGTKGEDIIPYDLGQREKKFYPTTRS